jgi:hypothetical protein
MDPKELFKRVIHVQEKHITFLDATQRNLAYYLFGKNVDLYKRLTIPRINVRNVMNAFAPQPDNPVQTVVGAFIDELSVSEFRTTVRPYPVEGKEPYDSYADMLEQQLGLVHRRSQRRLNLRMAAFELLCHGYYGLYFDGYRYYFLTAYDLIPGDPNIVEAQAQPFIIRKTQVNKATLEAAGVDTSSEQAVYLYEWAQNDDLEMFTLYDVYVKHADQNIGFTQKGTVVYDQKMAHPKRYPISIANSTEILASFYTVPVMTQLTQKLIDYQKANASIKESSASIAKPILTYDSDAGIDVDALHRSLKMGYKHIIVGKNREGDINFKAPGSLPPYAQQLPDRIEEDIMKHLGLNKTFMGMPSVGARERGALARLLKTSFRKLSSISSVIEEAFQELDQYILDYMANHTITYGRKSGIDIEQIFSGPVTYMPEERFVAYSSEDSLEKKSFVLNEWRSKLIPTRIALEQMGEANPAKVMEAMRDETRKNQEFTIGLTKEMQSMQTKSILDQVSDKLKGQLDYRFWVTPVADGKILVKINTGEVDRAAFILSDLSNRVKIESYSEEVPAPLDQRDPTVPESQPNIPTQTGPTVPGQYGKSGFAPRQSAAGQPVMPAAPVPAETVPAKAGGPSPVIPTVKKEEEPIVDMDIVEKAKGNRANAPVPEAGVFNPKEIEYYMSKGSTIYNAKRYYGLNGMYIVEPHAAWLSTGRKLALVTAANYSESLDKPYLFCGKQAYGVIILRKMYGPDQFDFTAIRKYHMVSDKERIKWWGDKPLYLYLFEFYPFKFPLTYKMTPGQTTFFGQVEITDDTPLEKMESSQDPTPSSQSRENEVVLEKIKRTPQANRGQNIMTAPPPMSSSNWMDTQ